MITKTVKEIGKLNFTGNVTPHNWFQHITKKETGKPYPLATLILSDIIYWYRPVYVRHEVTNKIIGIRKKFKADMLQKNYSDYAEFYGVTKHTIKRIIDRLIELGLLRREFRTIIVHNLKLNNVMFIEPITENIKKITELDDDKIESINSTEIEENEEELFENNDDISPPTSKIASRGSADLLVGCDQICKEGPSKFARTNTETTTKTTYKDNITTDIKPVVQKKPKKNTPNKKNKISDEFKKKYIRLFHKVKETFLTVLGDFDDYGIECKRIWEIIVKADKKIPNDLNKARDFLMAMILMFKNLIDTDDWWKSEIPFLPSNLFSYKIWTKVFNHLKNKKNEFDSSKKHAGLAALIYGG